MAIDPNTYFVPTYGRSGAPFVKGKGISLTDSKGKKFLDFGSGIAVTALGHSHPEIVKTLKAEGAKLLHTSNLYHVQSQIDLAKTLVKKSFAEKVFFCNSGTEANEAAIKFARKWASKKNRKKFNILSFTEGFHGRTYGGLSATAQEKFHDGFHPIISGFHYAPFNDVEATKAILDKNEFAAIFVEPVQGESGINSAGTKFLKFLRTYADKHKIALVFDEVQCGVGRTGSLWNYEQHGVIPDIMTTAKPIGGGLPLGAVLCKEEIANAIEPGDHGSTFGGNPLACALGSVVIKEVSKKSFLNKVNSKGKYLIKLLEEATKGHELVENVHGIGLMIGVKCKDNPAEIIKKCHDKGLLLIKAGNNVIRFMPALTVEKTEIEKAVKIFKSAIK